MKKRRLKIEGHGHVLPYPKQIPKSIKQAGYFDLVPESNGSGRLMMAQGFKNWTRPVTAESFFVEPRIKWMQEWGIDHTVAVTLSQLYCNGLSKKIATDIIAFQNDFHLELQTQNPRHFTAGFVVQPLYLDHALLEIEKRHKQGLSFLCLPTIYQDADGDWTTCTDDNCKEIYKLANELGLAVQIHPYDYEHVIKLKNYGKRWNGHTNGMPALTAEFSHDFFYDEIDLMCPNARFMFAHGNIIGLALTGRRTHGFHGRPDLYKGCNRAPGYALQSKNVFYDTIVHDWDLIDFMVKKVSVSQLIAAYDTPYPLGEVDGVKETIYPGVILDEAEKCDYITTEEKDQIQGENVIIWLFGEDADACKKFKERVAA